MLQWLTHVNKKMLLVLLLIEELAEYFKYVYNEHSGININLSGICMLIWLDQYMLVEKISAVILLDNNTMLW